MYAMKEEDCLQAFHNLQDYQKDQFLLHHHHPQILPWSTLPSFDSTNFSSNPTRYPYPDPVHPPPYFNTRRSSSSSSPSSLNYYDTLTSPPSMDHNHNNHLRILSEALGPIMRRGFDGHDIMAKMSAQEVMDAKALAASKSHSEAERRRRERINTHLSKLRSILPNTTKTDKASLLAEVIQHMKELKRQTSQITDTCPIPTESDELTVDSTAYNDEEGNFVIRASFCCQDRNDLMHDVIKALKTLRLRTLKAEIATVGGRVKNVLFLSREDEEEEEYHRSFDNDDDDDNDEDKRYDQVSSIEEALKAVIEKCVNNGENDNNNNNNNNLEQSSSGSIKRQRTSKMVNQCY